jgi:hypothetical protein
MSTQPGGSTWGLSGGQQLVGATWQTPLSVWLSGWVGYSDGGWHGQPGVEQVVSAPPTRMFCPVELPTFAGGSRGDGEIEGRRFLKTMDVYRGSHGSTT